MRFRSLWPGCLRRWTVSVPLLGLRFESRRGFGFLSLVTFVCYQVEISAYDNPPYGVLPSLQCLSDIWKFSERRDHDRYAVRRTTERKYVCMENLKVKILSIAYKSKQTAVLQTYYLQYNLRPIVSYVLFRDWLYVALWRLMEGGLC